MLPKLIAKNQLKLAISTKISACAMLSCQTCKKQDEEKRRQDKYNKHIIKTKLRNVSHLSKMV